MRAIFTIALLLSLSFSVQAENDVSLVRKAIDRCTLDQPGTRPFHLVATLAPSFGRDSASNRRGSIEIWWASPTQWKRDLTIPGFHLVEITDGSRHWQHSEGDYFPEWLREISIAIIQPVPNRDQVLTRIKTAEVRSALDTTYFSWMEFSSNGATTKAMGAGLALTNNSGLLAHGSGFGWDFLSRDYSSFHNIFAARTITASGGSDPEVTAKITILEDLGSVSPNLFDTTQQGSDPNPIQTLTVDEPALRKGLRDMPPPTWPALKDGPLEGAITTTVLVDRDGKVHDPGYMVSDNPGISDAARNYISSMQFQPYLFNGRPVQAFSRITLPFKTSRPAESESFDSARNYFEHGRKLISPAAGANTTPYILHATFQTGSKNGVVQGEYTDTWLSTNQWHREATLGKSRLIRSRNGDKTYLLSEGPEASLLQIVFKAIEPIPAVDTFVESDWRISRIKNDGASPIRIASGHEAEDGTLDAGSRGFWFNNSGILLHAHFRGFDTFLSEFQDFHDVRVPYKIDVLSNGNLAMRIQTTSIEQATNLSAKNFSLAGHDWKRQFTDEAR
jgi:hypothetical protein